MDRKVYEKELEVQTKETKTQELEIALTQTELDLANAVVLIQEKEAKVIELESERDQAIEVVTELINESPPEPAPIPKSQLSVSPSIFAPLGDVSGAINAIYLFIIFTNLSCYM